MASRVSNRSTGGGDGLRLPPHSVEAEQSVLGGLMLDAAAWDQVADRVVAADFYRNDHRLIFEAVAALIERNQPCDAVTLSGHLESQGLLDQVGGLSYLGSLARDTPTAANIRAYADIVRERSVLRQLITAGNLIVGSALEPEGREAREIVDDAERAVFEIAEAGSRGKVGFRTVKSILPDVVNRIDELYHSDGMMTGVATGFKQLDEMTSGLQPGDLIIVAGRPSMGKTTLAVNIAENAALGSNKSAAIFSMEMSAESLTLRMISSLGRINQSNLRSGRLQEEDWPRIDSAMTQLSNAKIYVDETPGLTPTEIRARARRLKRERGLDLIVVDYLQLMQVAGTKENRATEISEISRSLKALAKELKVPIIALSQLNRGVEQRENKKPVMSDLRECVTGETLVCLASGQRVPIRELVGTTPEVWAMSEDQKIIKAQSDLVWSKGVRQVFRLQLASGRNLRATSNHRVFTGDGWRVVGQLRIGDRVAVARRFPIVTAPVIWSDEQIALLGHLVGDGSYLTHQPLRYTTASEENSKLVTECAQALGSTVTRHPGRGNWHQLVIAGNGNRWHAKGVGAWLKGLGIFNQRSHQKHLPREVFQFSDAQIGLLLKHLWATDGCIHVRPVGQRGGPTVHFSTCSEQLAGDVSALLLRVGVVARISQVQQKIGRPVYSVSVSGSEQQALFLARVGAFGPREAPAKCLAAKIAVTRSNPNVDTLPQQVFSEVRLIMNARGVSPREMASMRGRIYSGNARFRFSPSRATLNSYADLLDSDALKVWSNSDLFWDRVVAVGLEGEEEVFDMTVPGPASWLADGVVSHNSGALEQDSDLILLIYREEFYDPNTTRKGIADIIIAKQRNGPTGDVQLTFLGQYTKFENYAPESYAEGVFR
ncbi:MAG TPA: replicative DNA helicase [Steroidobacteraceae bacterium]|nr:replicative DNA helicase [Steroidobacteraceae bacterium]